MVAEVKAAVVSPEERQLRFWARGVEGSYRKVGHPFPWKGVQDSADVVPQFHLDIQEEQLKAGMNPSEEAFGVEPEDRHGEFHTALVYCQPGAGQVAFSPPNSRLGNPINSLPSPFTHLLPIH